MTETTTNRLTGWNDRWTITDSSPYLVVSPTGTAHYLNNEGWGIESYNWRYRSTVVTGCDRQFPSDDLSGFGTLSDPDELARIVGPNYSDYAGEPAPFKRLCKDCQTRYPELLTND